MGVYIPNWEKPKSCDECWAEYAYEICNSHSDCCPLVPVPPHGRLIDADALEKDIDKYIGGEESRSRFHHWVQVQNVVIPGNKGEQT